MDILKTIGFIATFIAAMEILIAVGLFVCGKQMPWWVRTFPFDYLFSRFQWYRKWHGGRWEYWYIELCYSFIWLRMPKGKGWPESGPCSGRGTPLIEDYPYVEY